MNFFDIFKKSFLEGYASLELGTVQIVVAMSITLILAIYIYFCYKVLTRRTFYSKNFNISLVAVALITAAIILTIQSSLVVSLGMVGALSIVRFRTAIKDPMDLVFLFWSISLGIICGAGLSEIALILSLVLTIIIYVLDKLPVTKAPKILVVNGTYKEGLNEQIKQVILANTKYVSEKTKKITGNRLSIIYELRIKDDISLIEAIKNIDGVDSASLLEHDGEVTY